MEAAVGKPVGVAESCEKYVAFGEPHQLPEAVLPASDQDVFAGVQDDAAQGETRKDCYGEITANGSTL